MEIVLQSFEGLCFELNGIISSLIHKNWDENGKAEIDSKIQGHWDLNYEITCDI